MKFKRYVAIVLTILLSIAVMSACKNNTSFFELAAFTENSDSGAYDSEIFYRNDQTIFGADASCIYVPEGRHSNVYGEDKYGGYYYMYPSAGNVGLMGLFMEQENDQKEKLIDEEGRIYKKTNPVYKSKDLVNWELCGAVDGKFSTVIYADDWAISGLLAPDPIYDENTGKYFIYEQTNSKFKDDNPLLYSECPEVSQVSDDYYYFDRFYIGIYVSDYPTGPFVLATSENYYGDTYATNLNGKVITRFNPQINFRYDLNIEEPWGTIDAHPFIDEDGQLYLYFCHHIDSAHPGVDIWGMKMKDMITPDYSTMTLLIKGGYTTVTKNGGWGERPWAMSSYDMGEEYILENGSHGDGNEGAFMIAKNYIDKKGNKKRRYILCYSGGGYNNKYYDISQTISDDNPLGPFMKPEQYASSIVGTSVDNDWCMGCGHGSLVYSPSGDELFILGWSHCNTEFNAGTYGRWYVVDKVYWANTDEYGPILYGNGPTKSLQPNMYDYMGYTNIAGKAKVIVKSKGKNTGKEYLTDGLFVSHKYYDKWEFQTEGETQIVLEFDSPKTIRAVLVYNSYKYDNAFSKLDYIEFDLSEKPQWFSGKKYVPTARVSDIKFSKDFIGTSYEYIRSGCACLASFNEIRVNSVTISVSEKIKNDSNNICISDIVVIGK